ncbi:hypothetical protein NKT77_07245 [Moraxella sp. FZLJ2107]|uniref:hypothetical protein n=1 Tax=unclassified Moraxella TaxID=2685852 RepID=UPI00209BEEFA|nr:MULTISPECIES: hypothetical protein [unclassified Moraxella]USZ13922.1 hypothetical protein NGM44_05800 [Moraxella sp. FZFQ2102]UTO04326.1 hypothetical protein NKT77_07245 [Moraxella sp. FZLJ2107]UTO23159.1 hypothetical protein NKU06_04030 [Moraxella sp. FZLJ2109]
MKTLKLTAVIMAVMTALTGCAATKSLLAKRDNGSLDYRTSEKIAPLQLPAEQPAAEFVPLYPTPTVNEKSSDFINEAGKQYELPKPPSVR